MNNQICKNDLQTLLSLIFDEDETVCSSSTVFATPSKSQSEVSAEDAFLTINPVKGFRRLADVTAFRSFLVEIDPKGWDQVDAHEQKRLLEWQTEYIRRSGLPYSASIFSGNKSIHFLVVLDEPFQNHDEYKFHFRWLSNILGEVDVQAGNAIIGVRVPGHVRSDTGKMQRLDCVKGRVPREEFLAFLEKHSDARPRVSQPFIKSGTQIRQCLETTPQEGAYGRLNRRTLFFLMAGAPEGEWHGEFRLAVKDLKAQNYSIEEAEAHLTRIEGYLDTTDKKQIRYGYENFDWEMGFRPLENVDDTLEDSKGGDR
ncbi:MAG: hypothetical protein K2X47_06820 [Bdellovibrionales bacterium]|nr:hypothetical protein [Bdellovibrionales bacterium]